MSLKILHFTPDMSQGNGLRDTIHHILDSMGNSEEVHLATLSPVPTDLSGHYTCHCIGNGHRDYGHKGMVNLLALQKRFLILLYGMMPDIIHIHGSYSFISSRIELWSRKRGFPVVFSPYGGMNPAFIDAEYGMRTWKMILYQKNMSSRATALQVSDPAEGNYLRQEGISRRVEYIEPPYSDDGSEPDYDYYTADLLRLYHKSLDTEPGKHLDVNSREAISALLHLCLSEDTERRPLCAEDILNLRSLGLSQWHDIRLFAQEHDILPILESGCQRMQLRHLLEEEESPEVFPLLHPKSAGQLTSDRLLSGNRRRQRMIDNITLGGEAAIRKACIMIENIQFHIKKRSLTLRHLCDLYEYFRYYDMDEHRLSEVLKHLRRQKLCRRLCQVLAEAAYLDDGFMPVEALNDSGTERIRKTLMTY